MVRMIPADLTDPRVLDLLSEHLADMRASSPPEAVFALDLAGLRRPEITLWTAWEGDRVVACGALREMAPEAGEIKSMRTARAHQRRGFGRSMLTYLLDQARRRGYRRVFLETGSGPAFAAALGLYAAAGFEACAPFPPYGPSEFNRFFCLTLGDGDDARGVEDSPLSVD